VEFDFIKTQTPNNVKHAILLAQLAAVPVVSSVSLAMQIFFISTTIVVILTVPMGIRKSAPIIHAADVQYFHTQNASLAIQHVNSALLLSGQIQLHALVVIHLE